METPQAAASEDDPCGAARFADLVGQPAEAAETIPDPKRVLPAGSVMTMDHRPDRTNVDLDEAGVITRIWCG